MKNAKAILRALVALNSDGKKASDYSAFESAVELASVLKDCNAAIEFFGAPRLRGQYGPTLRALRRAQATIICELRRRMVA